MVEKLAMDQKTVFISYRRTLSKHLARSIYMDLKANGWDVFLDVNDIDNGNFDTIILNQIGARVHFILLVSPNALAGCVNSDDWLLREIQEAVRLKRNIIPILEEGVDFVHEMSYLPPELRTIISKKNSLPLSHFYFEAAVDMLRNRFLKPSQIIRITMPPPAERIEVERRMVAIEASPFFGPSSLDLMPAPFEWIDLPGEFGKKWKGKPYSIAKYPVTNAQFAEFIHAGGYHEPRWWTEIGWKANQEGWNYDSDRKFKQSVNKWREPRYWNDPQWNELEQPVVGISWYEAVAFCLWLSDASGENIMLPTNQQWQYAAQGDDGRIYPWGNDWYGNQCNSKVRGIGIGKTTPVRKYEGIGDSPFGVVDMSGNVWEWCLTDYDNRTNDMNSTGIFRVLQGSYWGEINPLFFACANRERDNASVRKVTIGFRIARY
jgi:formylglycine-generating enzyme required for sulfatase activity